MNTSISRIIAHLLLLFTAPWAQAQITWDNRSVHIDATIGQTSASAKFTFTNSGDTPIEITSVDTSCGCTTTDLGKTTYAPGESGVIKSLFEFGDRHGKQVKRITVRTDHDASPVSTLTMRVQIPTVLTIRPRMVYWRAGEATDPKTLDIQIELEQSVSILEVIAEEEGFTTAIEEITPGQRYTITVTPADTGSAKDVRLRLVTNLPEEQEEGFTGFYVLARTLPGNPVEPSSKQSP